MDISTKLANINLPVLLYNAAGCRCTKNKELDILNVSQTGAILTKSSTIKSIITSSNCNQYYDDIGGINHIGLSNMGYEYYLNYYISRVTNNKLAKPFIHSLYAFDTDELKKMFTNIYTKLDMLHQNYVSPSTYMMEINLSCPNTSSFASGLGICYDFELFESYLDTIKNNNVLNIPIGIKLAPYFNKSDFNIVSNLLLKYDIDYITCINTLPNSFMIDIYRERPCIQTNNGQGGLSGKYIQPISLANIYNFHNILHDKIDIVACGGISSGEDIVKTILCGAKAVQIGTILQTENYTCINRIIGELYDIMRHKNYKKIRDFIPIISRM